MFTSWFKYDLAPLVLRVGLGVIFIYHGYQKVLEKGGTAWNPEMAVAMQLPVAWGEFLGGIALLAGFLSRIAAAGIIVIMAGAIAMVHGAKGFGLQHGGYEYNFALIAMCLAVILLGSGSISVDRFIWRRRKA